MERDVYHVRMKSVLLAVAVLFVAACVATATLAPGPPQGVCVDTRSARGHSDLLPNMAGSGEMRLTEGVRCRSMEQRGS
jgi:hypothetical protein